MKNIFTNLNMRPINKTAGLVTSTGFEFKPIKQFEFVHKNIPSIIDYQVGFCGVSFGRLTVIGFHCVAKRGGRWVARCSCGNYLIVTGKRIVDSQKNKEIADRCMCDECDYLNYIKSNRSPTKPVSKNNRSIKKLKKDKK